MGDELRGESLVHLNVRFSTETELKEFQDLLYENQAREFLSQDCWKQWSMKRPLLPLFITSSQTKAVKTRRSRWNVNGQIPANAKR